MQIREITSLDERTLEEVKRLMLQLGGENGFDEASLRELISSPYSHIYAASKDNSRILGLASLCIYHAPSGKIASIEDVIVDEPARGKHIGKALMERILEEARREAPIKLKLTSRPSRIAANKLYLSLGFSLRETNPYELTI